MSKSNQHENDIQDHVFLNAAIAGIGDVGGLLPSAVPGSLYLSLHTASPGEAGLQTSNELTYTPYARVAVPRSGAGFVRVGNAISLFATISFATRTDGGAAQEATFFGIGDAAIGGSGKLRYFGALVGANLAYEATADAVVDTIYAPGSAYSVNDRVVFFPGAESTLPGGITDGMVAWIKTAPGAGVYTLSTVSAGGLLLDITSIGACIVQKLSTILIAQNTTPQLTTGTKVIED